MNDVLKRMFSSDGDISSGRVGNYIGLVSVVILTAYDTYVNGKLDPILAGILVSGGTISYGITKNKEGSSTMNSNPPQKDQVESEA